MNILITGGSTGLGFVLKGMYQAEGHEVTSWSRREGVDIRHPERIVEAMLKVRRPFDLVVHNAGIWVKDPPLYPVGALPLLLATNVSGPARVQWLLHEGHRIKVGGVVATTLTYDLYREPLLSGQLAYNVSKHALLGLTKSWRAEYPMYQYVNLYPKVTPTAMYDPSLGPPECSIAETIEYMKGTIDAVLLSSN